MPSGEIREFWGLDLLCLKGKKDWSLGYVGSCFHSDLGESGTDYSGLWCDNGTYQLSSELSVHVAQESLGLESLYQAIDLFRG